MIDTIQSQEYEDDVLLPAVLDFITDSCSSFDSSSSSSDFSGGGGEFSGGGASADY